MPLPQPPPSHQPAPHSADRSRERLRRLAVATGLCCLLALPAWAGSPETTNWALDPVHTRVMFSVSHAGFSQALGTVSGSHGSLQFDPDDWSQTRLDATVPLEHLEMGDEAWNRAVLARRLLDAHSHPLARFIADSAVQVQPGQGRVCGELSLHGVTRPLCMDVTVNAIKRHPMPPFRRTAGFSATAQLSRSDYGIDAWPTMISDEITIRIEAEAVRSHEPAPEAASAPATPTEPTPEPTTNPEPIHESEKPR